MLYVTKSSSRVYIRDMVSPTWAYNISSWAITHKLISISLTRFMVVISKALLPGYSILLIFREKGMIKFIVENA